MDTEPTWGQGFNITEGDGKLFPLNFIDEIPPLTRQVPLPSRPPAAPLPGLNGGAKTKKKRKKTKKKKKNKKKNKKK